MKVITAITAAGASTRMGRPKALLTVGGRPFVEVMTLAIEKAGLPPPLVILGADAERIEAEVSRLGVEVVENPDHARGRFTSILKAARRARGARLLLWPVDCPGVRAETILLLLEAARERPGRDIVPVHEGRGGHPVLLSEESVAEIMETDAETGNLREIVARRRHDLPVDDPGVLDNLNTYADYDAFLTGREVTRE